MASELSPRRGMLASIGGAVAGAFLASACCLGPLLLGAVGLGGGALFIKLEPYRPWFAALTLGLLAAGFRLAYRKPKAVAEGCGCEVPRGKRGVRIALWVAAVVAAGLLVAPYALERFG